MKTFNYYEYNSKRFDRSAKAEQVRNFIFAFKDGKKWATDYAADMVAKSFSQTYGDKAGDFVLVCAPAANSKKYTKRFSHFASKVSQEAKVQNGNDHLFIHGERTAKHNSANHVSESFGYRVALDREYFKGKKVIIFDDVITSGATAQEFASQLAECGAEVMGAMFLAITKRMYN